MPAQPPLICPRQDAPPVDSQPTNLFGKLWWHFFHNTARILKQLSDAVDITTSGTTVIATVQAILRLTTTTPSNPLRTDASNDVVSGPIDLGATTDVQATGVTSGHLLQWNGTKVVDGGVAPDVNAYLSVNPTVSFTCTTSFADVGGLVLPAFNKNGFWLIIATLDMTWDSAATAAIGQLVVAGTGQPGFVVGSGQVAGGLEGTYSQHWIYGNSGSNVAKIQAKMLNSGTANLSGTNNKLTAIFLHT